MLFLKIVFKFLIFLVGSRILRISSGYFNSSDVKKFDFFSKFPIKIKLFMHWGLGLQSEISTDSNQPLHLDIKDKFELLRENKFLLKILCWLFRINLDKDFETILLKKFCNIPSDFMFRFENKDVRSVVKVEVKKVYDSVENKIAHHIVDSLHTSFNKDIPTENVFLHNTKTSVDFLTKNAELNINYRALEDFYAYLKMFGDEQRLSKYPAEIAYKPNAKLRKKTRVPKNFKGGRLAKKYPELKSHVTEDFLRKQVNTLKQVEFLLKNKSLILSRKIKLSDIDISPEVKSVMFSYYNPEGPYGADTVIYTSDLFSRNKILVSRRTHLINEKSVIKNLVDLNSKTGFSNSNLTSSEEWENAVDVPIGGWFTGHFYFINPLIVIGFLLYSVFEFCVLLYIMSFFFGNPYENIVFFIKYPLVYYYENLSSFPSPNYFFFSLLFWLYVLIVFTVHILELLDEDRFVPPQLSWTYLLLKDFLYSIFIWWCVAFCLFEMIGTLDLFLTRIFFVGTPGYPQIGAVVFLAFYDLFQLLSVVGYFSFFLDHFMHVDIKFPIFYYSDYAPLLQRYPLVQPYFIGDPYFNKPNFFLWLFDYFLNLLSGESDKSVFFSRDSRFVFQRELVQDIRKYNYIRKNLIQLEFVGQLYNRGWNGFNYRLDLQTVVDPIISSEQVVRFDWRFKNTHSNGLYSRLFRPVFRFGSVEQKEPVKTVRLLRGLRYSPRYGYLDYLRAIELDELNSRYHNWSTRSLMKHKKGKTALHLLGRGFKKSMRRPSHVKTFLFRPSKAKFRLLLFNNLPIRTKADRNFRNSSLFFRRHFNLWSFLPGNSKPHRRSFFTPFVSFQDFSALKKSNFIENYLSLNKTVANRSRLKSQKVNPYLLRNTFLKQPSVLFPTSYINESLPFFKTEVDSLFEQNSSLFLDSDFGKFNDGKGTSKKFNNLFQELSFDTQSSISSKSRNKNLQVSKNLFFTKFSHNSEIPVKQSRRKQPFFKIPKDMTIKRKPKYQILRKKRIKVSSIPHYPFQGLKKYRFISTLYTNFEPKYFLRPVSSFTTFSKLDYFSFKQPEFVSSKPKLSMKNFSNLSYPFGLFFLGFGKFFGFNTPFRFVAFDCYYSQNHNIIYSFVDNYLKKNQFRTLPTFNARFKHPINGGLRYSLDFLYPMISELRLKEKLIPLDFVYETKVTPKYRHLRVDPYQSIRNAKLSKGPCYLLDAKIQNWLHFYNVIWNEYYHFYFNRSFKTENNGLHFRLASFNPIGGPQSYKLFIGSVTLETPRVGQYFYNYIPWLQYKFKWLLYPTSTYKRFDTFRAIHQHSNKKFYFTSLLKFYQMNLFRWQQFSQIYQWNYTQSRNFMIHLFFHKYRFLSFLSSFNDLFSGISKKNGLLIIPNCSSEFVDFSNHVPKAVSNFNEFYFSTISKFDSVEQINLKSMPAILKHQFYKPSFTVNDFRFFQYVIDLRRWKALQTSYIRDWKFENYVKYLGPLLYKEDVASLMGFFAPFEYRNQVFVSRMKNDAMRFSVFFPKKIIDDKYVNPIKRLKFPHPRFSRAISADGARRSLPSFYAYIINKPFILNAPNYSFLNKKGNKVLHGFYSHLHKFNLPSDLNLNYGIGFGDSFFVNLNKTFSDFYYGFKDFFELNTKKKRLLKDKDFWLSRNYELQDIRNSISSKERIKPGTFGKFFAQLGKPFNLDVPKAFGKYHTSKRSHPLVDLNLWRKAKAFEIISKESIKKKRMKALLYPSIYKRFSGPKANSGRWHKGQSWLKFVVASQNVSVRPQNARKQFPYKPLKKANRLRASMNSLVHSHKFFDTYVSSRPQFRKFHSPNTAYKRGYFNFGLSGIGRLPRLSRSFFHMLFFRNKLDDFKLLKINFLKLYLMSLPLFNNSDFVPNCSFKVFWSFILGLKTSRFSDLKLRYGILFNNFNCLKQNMELSTYVYHPFFGSLMSYYDSVDFVDGNLLFLNNQYTSLKAHRKFLFFSHFTWNNLRVLDEYGRYVYSFYMKNGKFPLLQHSSYFVDFVFNLYKFYYFKLVAPFFDFFVSKIKVFSFEFFNNLFIKSFTLTSTVDKSVLYLNKNDKESRLLDKFENKYISYNSVPLYTVGLSYQDFFRVRYYFGSFRSNLHWYFYPIHYFLSMKFFLFKSFYDFISSSLFFGASVNLKYFQFYNSFRLNNMNLFLKRNSFFSYVFAKNLNLFHYGSKSIHYVYTISDNRNFDFLYSFNNLFSGSFMLSNSDGFSVKLHHRLFDYNSLVSTFLYRNSYKEFCKYFITFDSFFFSIDYLMFLHKFDVLFSYDSKKFLIQNSLDYVFDIERFIDNLEYNIKSIDGSGRHNRPKSVSQTLNKVFTYREYEKYRKEHHRQRFRGISPHWIQTSFKNRFNFKHYYRSDFSRTRRLKINLNRMSKYNGAFRIKNSPKTLRHVSFIHDSIDERFLNKFLNRSVFDSNSVRRATNYGKSNIGNSSINFVDASLTNYSQDDVIKQKVSRRFNPFSIFRTEEDFVKQNKKVIAKRKIAKHYQYAKIKKPRVQHKASKYSLDYIPLRKTSKFDSVNTSYKKKHLRDLSYSYLEQFMKAVKRSHKMKKLGKKFKHNLFQDIFKLPLKKQFNDYFRNLVVQNKKTSRLKYVPPQLGSSFGEGSFLNARNSGKFSNIFQKFSGGKFKREFSLNTLKRSKSIRDTSRAHKMLVNDIDPSRKGYDWETYFKRRTPLRFSSQRMDSKVPNLFERPIRRRSVTSGSRGLKYPQHKVSLRALMGPKLTRKSPRYLGYNINHRDIGVYNYALKKTSLGGLSSASRANYMMQDPGHRARPKRGGKLKKHGHIMYAPNVKRFIRPYNKVLMHIPYLYSKWFTQNPRLSTAVDPDSLILFLNNQYDEFYFICVQSLFLLKRKIMYNVINLKLISYKHKILYFMPLVEEVDRNHVSRLNVNDLSFVLVKNLYSFLQYFMSFIKFFNFDSILFYLYELRQLFLVSFFNKEFYFVRLLYNPHIAKFKHDSQVSSDSLFFDDYYYRQTSKRLLSQIAFMGHSIGGWNNPLGLLGQYMPGLNFYSKGATSFNFNYQYPDFYSARAFSPELLLDNNLVRQNTDLFDRNFFYNEFYVDANYRRSWHFLSYRVSSPVSPFIEYERPHDLSFKNIVRRRHRRLPLASLRRVHNVYPDHMSAFFSTLMSDVSTFVGHDVTLPYKLKLLNYKVRSNTNAFYLRTLINHFKTNSLNILNVIALFNESLRSDHLNILADFYKRVNLSSLVNNRRFALRHNVWLPFKYNFYYKFNWRTYLHKYESSDPVGYRRYKLSSIFDLYHGGIPFSLKLKALQHLIVSQIPRFEIDSRRRVPLNISAQEFNLLLFNYFKYVSDNFVDPGYNDLGRKIFRYVNRKVHPFLYSYVFDKNENSFIFKDIYNPIIAKKKLLKRNLKFNSLQPRSVLQIPEYFPAWKVRDPTIKKNFFTKLKHKFAYYVLYFFYEFPFDFRKWVREAKFLFDFSNYRTLKTWASTIQVYFSPSTEILSRRQPYDRYRAYQFIPRFKNSRQNVSRIFGIYTLFDLKKYKERSLNPAVWLHFDLFSRVRPSFKPFITKFSKNFMFSKFMPSYGISSYNFYVKSHTSFDNFFDKHPYISFGIGAPNLRDALVSSESSYKEVKRRSHMLDFIRSHNHSKSVFGDLLFDSKNYYKPSGNFIEYDFYDSLLRNSQTLKKQTYDQDHENFKISLLTQNVQTPARILRKGARRISNLKHLLRDPLVSILEDSGSYDAALEDKENDQFGSRFIGLAEVFSDSKFGDIKQPLEGSYLLPRPNYDSFEESLSQSFHGSHEPHDLSLHFGRKRSSSLLLKDSIYFSFMANPHRRTFFLNTLLLRPNNAFLRFVRSDNFFFFKHGLFSLFPFAKPDHFREQSVYSPNLKVFFDFNAFKQRYNLGLLFRDLSFERDFELFIFRKNSQVFKVNPHMVSEFTSLTSLDYFNFFYSGKPSVKGPLFESKFVELYFYLEKFFFKLNPLYFLIVVIDFYLFCLFGTFSVLNAMNSYNFSFFFNLFNFDDTIFYYTKKRHVFSVFFHMGLFTEYFKFSWLFSLKFLIFNIEYYPYYFFLFCIVLMMRMLSFNVQKMNQRSPFIVPYVWRFSDLKFNSHSGWFDSAWSEIKSEALTRLHELHSTNKIQLSHEHLFSFEDIKSLRKKHQIKNRKYLVEFDNLEFDISPYNSMIKDNVLFSKPVTVASLKGSLSKIRYLGFLFPSKDYISSDKLQQVDSDILSRSDIALNQESPKLNKRFSVKKIRFSSKLFYKYLKLFLSRKITFSRFLNQFKFGDFVTLFQGTRPFFHATNYTVDDFGDEFGKLFVDPNSEFNFFLRRNLIQRRMFPDDENIHFYRKPGSILYSEVMARKYGTEVDQLHYVMEFPGRFNNHYINSFSRVYSTRNLSYNNPQMGFFSFSKNAKLPTNFEEFLIFCSYTPSEIEHLFSSTVDPHYTMFNPRLSRLHELWTLFQYVTKYEYNMFNEYNVNDVKLLDFYFEERPTLFTNLKFWVNKAATDAVDFNFFQRSFFLVDEEVSALEVELQGGDHATSDRYNDKYDSVEQFAGENPVARVDSSPFFSFFYLLNTYFFLFVFFVSLSFFFCFIFLFLYSLLNYILLFI